MKQIHVKLTKNREKSNVEVAFHYIEMITEETKQRIKQLQKEYLSLKKGKDALLLLLEESEIPEGVYNSNAIENSTLSLPETEQILLEMEVTRTVSLREVFEAKNLARIMDYIRKKSIKEELTIDQILLWHQMLMMNINENISGHFREKDEYVLVGTHIAAAPKKILRLTLEAINNYNSDLDKYFVERIATFHLAFEHIHPFNDGNGRMGRLITNYQFIKHSFPPIIIRNKEKQDYYKALKDYDQNKNIKPMARLITLALLESLHKRIAYLKGQTIIPLTDYAKKLNKTPQTILNTAKRQTLPAFRERGSWKIGI